MPSVTAQVASPTTLSITSSLNGVTWTLTKAEIQAYYRDHTGGNAAERKAQVIAWIKAGMLATLGEGWSDAAWIDVDVDLADDTQAMLLTLSGG